MKTSLEGWKAAIAQIEDLGDVRTYLGDVHSFEVHGLPEFIAHPTREFVVLPVMGNEADCPPDLGENREVIKAVVEAGLKAFQLVVEWNTSGEVSEEPAVIGVSREPGFAAVDFEVRLAGVWRALGGPPTWLLRDVDGLWSVSEGARSRLPQNSPLEALSEGCKRLYKGRSGTCRPLGLTRPQNSLSGLLFSKMGLSYDGRVSAPSSLRR